MPGEWPAVATRSAANRHPRPQQLLEGMADALPRLLHHAGARTERGLHALDDLLPKVRLAHELDDGHGFGGGSIGAQPEALEAFADVLGDG